jgi:hypothetical protein
MFKKGKTLLFLLFLQKGETSLLLLYFIIIIIL